MVRREPHFIVHFSKVFGATISIDLHEEICEKFSRVVGGRLQSCVLIRSASTKDKYLKFLQMKLSPQKSL